MKKVKSAYDDMDFGTEYSLKDFEFVNENIYYERNLSLYDKTESLLNEVKEYKTELIKNGTHLTKLLAKVGTGTQYRIITEGYVFPHSIIPYLITQRGTIDVLNVTVFFITYEVAKLLYDCVVYGGVKKLNVILSSLRMHSEKPPIWLKEFYNFCLTNDSVEIGIANCHAKVVACKVGEDYYVFEGSLNVGTAQALIEQMVLDNNKQVFDFHSKWFECIISKYKSNARNYRNDFVGRW